MANSETESFEQPDEQPEKPKEEVSQQGQDELMLRLNEALEANEDDEPLHNVGDLLYQTFTAEQYSPEMVLNSVKEVYEEHKGEFDPKIALNSFIQAFGPGLIKLCQQKIVELGEYDLGQFGEKNDGVDGRLGRKTAHAFNLYFEAKKPSETDEKIASPEVKIESTPPVEVAGYFHPEPSAEPHEPYVRYKPGNKEAIITPKQDFEDQIKEIYSRDKTTFSIDNLHNYFGNSLKEVGHFIVYEDPCTGENPITFLGRPIPQGMNLMAIPFLKVAEEQIQKSGVNYEPHDENIGGFKYRDMFVGGKPSGVPSFHKFGLGFDIDYFENGPSYKKPKHLRNPAINRGNIPDQVVLAMVNAGFAWGGVKNPAFGYLGDDPMHFQLRFHPDDPAAQEIINNSPIGRKYWKKIAPMLKKIG